MKIGILIDRLNVGGVEKIAIEQVRSLIAEGHDAELIVMRRRSVVADAFSDLLKNIPVNFLDSRLPPAFRGSFGFPFFNFFSFFHLSYALFLPFVVKDKEYDYIITHGTYTAITAIALKKRRHIGFSVFIWDPVSYLLDRVYVNKIPRILFKLIKSIALPFDRYIIKNTDSVLVGGHAHDDFIKSVNPNKPIDVIYPSVYPAKKLGHKDGSVLVITAWKRGKNPEYLVDLIKALPTLNIKMAGKWVEDEYRNEFEQFITQNNVQDNIEILGAVSEEELSRLYSASLVLLQTNDDRGFGMPAIEAAAHGTTFIIPKGQGVCDLFTDGEHGYYTTEMDTKTIVSLLSAILSDPKLAIRMGRAAWAKVKENYSWQQHAVELAAVASRYTDPNNGEPEYTIPKDTYEKD